MARFYERLGVPAAIRRGGQAGDNPAAGIAWMLLAAACVTLLGILVKALGQHLHGMQIAALRAWLLIVVLGPFLWMKQPGALRPKAWGLLALRTACLATVNGVGFWALTVLPLVLVTAIGFAKPVFVTLLAVLFLGERIQWRRGSATLVGFLGVLIALDLPAVQDGALPPLALAAAIAGTLAMAASLIIGKRLIAIERPNTIVFWSNLGAAVILTAPAVAVWQTPSWIDWLLVAALALVGYGSQQAFLRAFRAAEAGLVAPFEYIRLLFAAAAGFLLFGEVPSPALGAGAVLIIGSALYISRREARLARLAPPQAEPPIKPGERPA